MQASAVTVCSMGVDAPLLLWIGGGLLLLGLFFALAGRRPARRARAERELAPEPAVTGPATTTDEA